MKILIILLMAIVVGGELHARGNLSESEALAAGYAAAFANMSKSRASLVYVNDSSTEILTGVREISAWGGVVMIRRAGGRQDILDPARIVRLFSE